MAKEFKTVRLSVAIKPSTKKKLKKLQGKKGKLEGFSFADIIDELITFYEAK